MRVVFEGSQMCIRTRCRTVEQLIGTFKHCVEGSSLFISTLGMRPVGTETPFVVALADRSIVMRGRGVIRQAWSTSDNRYQRPGVLLGVRALTRSSIGLFDQIRARAAADTSARVERPFEKTPPVALEITGSVERPFLDDDGVRDDLDGDPRTFIGPPLAEPREPAPPTRPVTRRTQPQLPQRIAKITIPPRPSAARPAVIIPPMPPVPPVPAAPAASSPSDPFDAPTEETDMTSLSRAPTEQVTPATVAVARTVTETAAASRVPAVPTELSLEAALSVAVRAELSQEPSRAESETTQPWTPCVVPSRKPTVESFKTRCEKKTVPEPTDGVIAVARTMSVGNARASTPLDLGATPSVEHGESFSGPTRVRVTFAQPHEVLPANPLADVTVEALAGFVDCTLFQVSHAETPRSALPVRRPVRRLVIAGALAVVAAVALLGAYHVRTTAAEPVPLVEQPAPAAAPIVTVTGGGAPEPGEAAASPNRISIDVVVSPPCRQDCTK